MTEKRKVDNETSNILFFDGKIVATISGSENRKGDLKIAHVGGFKCIQRETPL